MSSRNADETPVRSSWRHGFILVYSVNAAWKNIWFIYKGLYDVPHNAGADPAGDLTRLHRHSLEPE